MKFIDKRLEKFLLIDFPDFVEITEAIREENKRLQFTGGYRINQGRYRTKEEDALYRKNALNRRVM